MANKLYFTETSSSQSDKGVTWAGLSTSDSNVEITPAGVSVEVSDAIVTDIQKDKKIPLFYNGTTVTYEDKSITSVTSDVASQINAGTYLAPTEDTDVIVPFSKETFTGLVNDKIAALQAALADVSSSHPLKSTADTYITYLQGIDFDSETWPLSKFVGEYASDNSQTIIHESELI
jgi:hypothetical protein